MCLKGIVKRGLEHFSNSIDRRSAVGDHYDKGYIIKEYKVLYNSIPYKICITVQEINKRFSGCLMPYDYEIVSIIKGEASFIWYLEKEEHRKHKKYKYKPLIDFRGGSECFSKILK